MKFNSSTLFLIIALLVNSFVSFSQTNPPRVIIIGLDGIRADAYKTVKHPNLDKLFADGVISLTTRPVMPSVTMPNWTSHLTGSGPEEHGVTDNDWTIQNHLLQPLEADADGYYPSIFKLMKEQLTNAKTAFYYNWGNLINSYNRKYLDEVSFQGNYGYDSSYNKAVDFLVANQKNPTLVFLYSVHTDHAGHDSSWMSTTYVAAIEQADTTIGKMIDRLKKEKLYSSTYFMLITDHGGIQKGHGGVSMEEMQIPWAITGPRIKKAGIINSFNSNKNTALVLAEIFKITNLPKAWIGKVPEGVFK